MTTMKELIIHVTENAVEFVEELVKRIGGNIENYESKKKSINKLKVSKPQPFDFFDSWPDIPLDPKTYRKELWRKTQEF